MELPMEYPWKKYLRCFFLVPSNTVNKKGQDSKKAYKTWKWISYQIWSQIFLSKPSPSVRNKQNIGCFANRIIACLAILGGFLNAQDIVKPTTAPSHRSTLTDANVFPRSQDHIRYCNRASKAGYKTIKQTWISIRSSIPQGASTHHPPLEK